jgi:Tat-targeted selenate reductase subunit YnfE
MSDVQGQTMSRRTFVKGSALAALGAASIGAGTTSLFSEAAAEEASQEKIVWTHCAVNCGCCCAWKCHVVDDAITYVETDDTGSDEFGERQIRACLRGRSARRWLQDPDRLNYPLRRVPGTKRGEGKYEQISWDEALDTIASEMQRIRETYGDEAMTIHYSSGVSAGQITGNPVKRLFNLTGGVLNYYGSYSSAQISAAGTYTYGGGTYGSSFLTLQDNELVVLFGDAVAETRAGGCGHTYDLAMMREQHNCRIISIDPRCNDVTCGQGGEWIPIRPGTDGALVAALAYEIINNGWADEEFLHTYCVGYDEESMPDSAKGMNASYKDYILGTGYDMTPKTPAWAAPITGIPEQRIIDLAREMHEADPVYIAQGYGINRRSNGEIAARAVMVLPQLLGQIGQPGMNDGRREGCRGLSLGTLPTGTNPVATSIPTFMWPEAIKRGHELTATNGGVQGAEKMSADIKFIFNYAGNCLTNQHSDINYTHDLLQDESLCEFIVTSEIFMTDSAKYSDIILPDLTSQEQLSITKDGYSDNMIACIYGEPVYEPKFERRGIYEVCCDLAERLGVGEEFSEGKTREDWLRSIYESARENDPELPTWEEGYEMGVYKRDPEPLVALEAFIADPEANPLPTESGKIQIYSEKLADYASAWELAEDEVISPIPLYDPGFNGVENLTDEYPLLISGFQSKSHVHSSYANNEIIDASAHDCVWINPVDAEPRDIADGDECRVYTAYGELRIPAKVTPRVIPGTVCVPAGRWHDADMDGDRIDYGGCINTITQYRPSPLAKANPQHSNVGQVEKA